MQYKDSINKYMTGKQIVKLLNNDIHVKYNLNPLCLHAILFLSYCVFILISLCLIPYSRELNKYNIYQSPLIKFNSSDIRYKDMYYDYQVKSCATFYDTYYFCYTGNAQIIPNKMTTFRHYNNLLLWNMEYNIKTGTTYIIIFSVLYISIVILLIISQQCYNNSIKQKSHNLITLHNNKHITINQINDAFEVLIDAPFDDEDINCSLFSLSAHIVAFCEIFICLMLFCFLITGSVPKINQCDIKLTQLQEQEYGYSSIINVYDYTVNNGLKTYKKIIKNKDVIKQLSYKAQCYDGSDNMMTLESINIPQWKLKMIILCFCISQLLYHMYYIKFSHTPDRLRKLFEKYNNKLITQRCNA